MVAVADRRWNEALWPERTVDSTESDGDYQVTLRELIASPNAIYDVMERLGRGTFGQVVKCWKKDTNEMVAMKILKNTPSYAKQGQMEVDVLTRLSKLSSDDGSFVRAYESFHHHGHICIVFELLHTNLYDYLKRTRFEPLPLKYIRPIAQQVLSCLEKLSTLGLVHADLKPENIMLVDPQRFPFRVKVIDFGSAMLREKTSPSGYLQSRYYRAPEVIMGVPFDEAIDMWSLGCVLAELYLGWPLFPGACEFDQISYICETLGPLPPSLMQNITKTNWFFKRDSVTSAWNIKSSAQYVLETGIQSKESRKYIFHSLLDMAKVLTPPTSDSQESTLMSIDRLEFISLLTRMLTLDPSQRIKPAVAQQMPFLTFQHLAMHTHTPTMWEWLQCMQVCRNKSTSNTVPSPMTTPTTPLATPIQLVAPGCCSNHVLLPQNTALLPSYPLGAHLVCHVAPSTLGYMPLSVTTPTAPHLPSAIPLSLSHTPMSFNKSVPLSLNQAPLSLGHSPLSIGHSIPFSLGHTHVAMTTQIPTASHIHTRTDTTRQQNNTYHTPSWLNHTHNGNGHPSTQLGSMVIQDQVTTSTAHLHGNQGVDLHPNKLLPLQLPAYHPFSRL